MLRLRARLLAVIGLPVAACSAAAGSMLACSSGEAEPRSGDVVVPTSSATAATDPPPPPPTQLARPDKEPEPPGKAWQGENGICARESDTSGSPSSVGACKQTLEHDRTRDLAIGGMHGFSFDADASKRERAKIAGACCFRVIRPPLGRPLRDGGAGDAPVVAEIGAHPGWTEASKPDAKGLSDADREALAARWARDGALEHASVAEFSRLSLSLLALAAPSDLVEAAHRAALDEVRHAELCFGLASALVGRTIGPGPLAVERAAPPAEDFVTLALETLRDGCVGETLASLEALRAKELATDEAAIALLTQVAEDEARHAELAYAIVVWTLREGDGELRAKVAAEAQRLADESPAFEGPDDPDATRFAPWGRLPTKDRADALRTGFRDVVRPALLALADRARG